MLPDRVGDGSLVAAVGSASLLEDRVQAFASDLAQIGIECEIDVRESVAFLVAAGAGAEVRFADPEVRQTVLAMGRAHGFPRVALIVGDD